MGKVVKTEKSYSLRTAFIFLFAVLLVVFVGLTVKLTAIFLKSKFDGQHALTLAVLSDRDRKKAEVISFAPDKNSISLLFVRNSSGNLGQALEVPIDLTITLPSSIKESFFDSSIDSQMLQLFQNMNTISSNVTFIDILRLYLFTKSVSKNNITKQDTTLPLQDDVMDKISSNLFADFSLSQEKQSIEIINAAQIPGLGNRLGRFISNSGGNVVSITTSQVIASKTLLYYSGKKSYTAQRLAKILAIPIVLKDKQGLFDITIIVGTNFVTRDTF